MKNLINVFKLLLLLAVLSASSNTNLLAQLYFPGVNNLVASGGCFPDYNEMYISWAGNYGAPYKVTISGNGCTTNIILEANAINIIDGRRHATLFNYYCAGSQVRVVSMLGTRERGEAASCTISGCSPVGERNIPLYIESIDGINTNTSATIDRSNKTYRLMTGETLSVKFYQNINTASSSSIPLTVPSAANFWSPSCVDFGYPATTGGDALQMGCLVFNSAITGGTVKITATRNNTIALASQLVYAVVLKNGLPIDVYSIFAKVGTENAGYCHLNGDNIPTNEDYPAIPGQHFIITGKTASLAHTEAPINLYPILADQNISLAYTLPEAASVQVAIFNTMGEKMNHIADNMPQEAGSHEQNINVANLPKGIYFVRFQQGEAVQTRRFVKM